MSIGQRIRSMRTQQGLSIDELAYKLGKNRTTVYRYENGDIENLPLGILDSLAEALNTTPAHLMGWESPSTHYTVHESYENIEPKWYDTFELDGFNHEERQKLMEYAKFLLSIREN